MDLKSQTEACDLFPLLNQLAHCVRQRVSDAYASIQMNETRAGILKVLGNQSANITQKELSQALCLSESNICGLVERMREEGLIIRCRSIVDRRKSVLRLTDAGSSRLAEVLKLHQQCEQQLTQKFTERESREYVLILSRILISLSAEDGQQSRRVA